MTSATSAPIAGSTPLASSADAVHRRSTSSLLPAPDRACSVYHESLAVDPGLEDHGASQLIGVARYRISVDRNNICRATGGEREWFAESGRCSIREE